MPTPGAHRGPLALGRVPIIAALVGLASLAAACGGDADGPIESVPSPASVVPIGVEGVPATREPTEDGALSAVEEAGQEGAAADAAQAAAEEEGDAPGEADAEGDEPVADTKFDFDRGFYAAPFSVIVSSKTPGAQIGYTLDGSDPRVSGTARTGPSPLAVAIDPASTEGRPPAPAVVLRAYAFAEGRAPTGVDTQTYIFPDRVALQTDALGAEWPTYPYEGPGGPARHDYAMDPRITEDPAYREALAAGLLAIPSIALATASADFWSAYRGGAEIPVSVEILYPDDPGAGEQADGVLAAHSHDRVKRSLRLAFRRSAGDGKLDTQLLRRAPLNGDSAMDELDRLILRGGNNRSWARTWNPDRTTYAEDQWYRDSQIALSGSGSHGAFAQLYIDGIYWGLYNAVEQPQEHFATAYFGGEPEDWTAVNHDGHQSGEPGRWQHLVENLAGGGPAAGAGPADLAALEAHLDLDAFIDYLLLSWYAGIRDWPENNWWALGRAAPPTPFRFFAWDGEWSFGVGFGSPERPGIHPDFAAGADPSEPELEALPRLFHAAMRHPAFRARLAERAERHLGAGGALAPEAARARWSALTTALRQAVVAESARWGDATDSERPRTREDDWEPEVAAIDAYLAGAAESLRAALRAEGYLP